MARKRRRPTATGGEVKPQTNGGKLRGRPPGDPKTALARWIQGQGITVTDFATRLHAAAAELEMPDDLVPETKTLRDIVNRRHRPSLETTKLVRQATGGAVDLDQWVADMAPDYGGWGSRPGKSRVST